MNRQGRCEPRGENLNRAQEAPFGSPCPRESSAPGSAASPNLVHLLRSPSLPPTLIYKEGLQATLSLPPDLPRTSWVTQHPHPTPTPRAPHCRLSLGCICLWRRCWARWGWARRAEPRALGRGPLLHFFCRHGLPGRHFAFDGF